jgi:hypothetical protein
LYRPQICSTFQQVGGERMAQGVGESGRPVSDHSPDTARPERTTPNSHPELIGGGRAGQGGSPGRQVSIHGFPSGSPERNGALTVSLAGHPHKFPIANLVDPQPG